MFQTEEIMIDETLGAKLTVMTQFIRDSDTEERRRPAVLILPGGGYTVCSDTEGENIAMPYIAAGYQAFVLRYAVGSAHPWPAPLEEYEEVMDMILANSGIWHVDPDKVAVIGFSAGGHLAGCAATVSGRRPAAAILVYGALNAASAALCMDGLPDPSKEVDDLTPPCFLATASDDSLLGSLPTLDFAQSLARFGIRYEMHVYAQGEHGFAGGQSGYCINPMCSRVRRWQQDSIAFLEDLFGEVLPLPQGMGEPRYGSRITGDRDAHLSIRCTVGHLMKQMMAKQVIEPVYRQIEDAVRQAYGPVSGQVMGFVRVLKLDVILALLNVPDAQTRALNEALSGIPNEKETITL